MLLKEFFGRPIKLGRNENDKTQSGLPTDDLFWYILDHDKLHKDYFFPIAAKIKKCHENNRLNKEQIVQEFMPMVEKGCKEYYNKHNLQGKLGKLFPKDLREGLCERLFDHYYEDIIKDCYKIG